MANLHQDDIAVINGLLEQLQLCVGAVRNALQAERRPLYCAPPSYTEGLSETEQRKQLAELASAYLRPDRDDDTVLERPISGVMCVGTTTLESITLLNTVKAQLKEAVVGFKRQRQSLNLIARVAPGDANVFEAYKNMPPGERIDWWKAYTPIRTLEDTIDSISYTWATTPTQIIPVSFDDALEAAQQLTDAKRREGAMARLGQLDRSTPLSFRRIQTKKLRANLRYKEGGTIRRASAPISGIMVVCRDYLPAIVWREPNTGERLQRMDRQAPELLIPELNLFRGSTK